MMRILAASLLLFLLAPPARAEDRYAVKNKKGVNQKGVNHI